MLRAVNFEVPACTAAQNSHCQNQQKCPGISVVCPVGTPDAQLQAYRKIIGLADVVLYVHDADMSATDSGENRAFAFAAENHTPTLVLHPKELTAKWVGERFYPRRS